MPKDEMPNHNCIKHLRSVVQQQQTKIADLEKTAAEHKHQLAEQVRPVFLIKNRLVVNLSDQIGQQGFAWLNILSLRWTILFLWTVQIPSLFSLLIFLT